MFLSSVRVPSFARADRADRHVGVAAERALFQVAVVDADEHQDLAQALQVLLGLGRAAQVGLADDLHQRHAGAVEVDQRARCRARAVQVLGRVLFHVHARDAAPLRCAPSTSIVELAVLGQRQLVLRDLVALGQVRIEVVLAREHAALARPCSRAPAPARTASSTAPARWARGSAPGSAEAHGADLRVGRRAERRRAAAEQLRLREQLRVDLEADHGFVARSWLQTREILGRPRGAAERLLRARSRARTSRASSKCGAISCSRAASPRARVRTARQRRQAGEARRQA